MDVKEKSLGQWTRQEFEKLPMRKYGEDIGEFDSLIIIPTENIHDSGYRCMDFIAVRENTPLCRLSGCSDVIHFDGIGGFDRWLSKNGVPDSIKPKGWSIDCLATSGLLRIFSSGKLEAGLAL